MALPIVAVTLIGSLVTGFIAGLTNFFATRAGAMLAGAGLMWIAIKGLTTVLGFLVADLNSAISMINAGTGQSTDLAIRMMKLAAYAGLFDAINIVLSGYFAIATITPLRMILSRLNSGA